MSSSKVARGEDFEKLTRTETWIHWQHAHYMANIGREDRCISRTRGHRCALDLSDSLNVFPKQNFPPLVVMQAVCGLDSLDYPRALVFGYISITSPHVFITGTLPISTGRLVTT